MDGSVVVPSVPLAVVVPSVPLAVVVDLVVVDPVTAVVQRQSIDVV